MYINHTKGRGTYAVSFAYSMGVARGRGQLLLRFPKISQNQYTQGNNVWMVGVSVGGAS
jgi:hypothetical protein